jgi:hypothetical protein
MKTTTIFRKPHSPASTLELGQRLMLRCAGGYLIGAVLAAALGFASVGTLTIDFIVLALLFSTLLLAAGLVCSALGALGSEDPAAERRRDRG